MATYDYNSVQQAEKVEGGKYNARDVSRMLNVALITYVFTGAESNTETVQLWTPQAGLTVHNVGVMGAGTATATLDVGAGATGDSIADGVVVATGAFTAGDQQFTAVAKGEDIFATFAAVSGVAGESITIAIQYSKNT